MAFYLRLVESSGLFARPFSLAIFRFVPSLGMAFSERYTFRSAGQNFLLSKDIPPDELVSTIFYVSFEGGPVGIAAGVTHTGAEGALLRRRGTSRLVIEMQHQPAQPGTECTVYCPSSGDSRTGPQACIECAKGNGVVRICC